MKTKKSEKGEVWRLFQIKFHPVELDRLEDYFARTPGVKKYAILKDAIMAYRDARDRE